MALLAQKFSISPELILSYGRIDTDFNPNLGGPSEGRPIHVKGCKKVKGSMKLTCEPVSKTVIRFSVDS